LKESCKVLSQSSLHSKFCLLENYKDGDDRVDDEKNKEMHVPQRKKIIEHVPTTHCVL
jgi:hypothetical protein